MIKLLSAMFIFSIIPCMLSSTEIQIDGEERIVDSKRDLSLSEVLNNYYDAVGGIAFMESLKSMRFTADVERDGSITSSVILKKHPIKLG